MSVKKGTSKYDPYKDWILEHKDDYYTLTELMDALRTNFNLDVNRNSIKSWFKRTIGITTIYGTHEFTDGEKEFIKKYYPDHGVKETTIELNKRFHTNRKEGGVFGNAKKLGLKASDKYLDEINRRSGERLKIIREKPTRSIRTEIVHNQTVYRMKSADGRWRTAGIVIWEEANGPIPKGHKLLYLDGDNSNLDLDNLCLLPEKLQYQVIRNKHYKAHDPEITKSLIKYYELRNALGVDCWEWQNISKKFERRYGKELTT